LDKSLVEMGFKLQHQGNFAKHVHLRLTYVVLSGSHTTWDSIMTEEARTLSAYRLEKAKDVLQQAELLFQEHRYDGSINRSYYAIFHSNNTHE